MIRNYTIFIFFVLICSSLIATATPIPSANIDLERNFKRFRPIINAIGGQKIFSKRHLIAQKISEEYPKIQQKIREQVKTQFPNQNPKLITSLSSAEQYFNIVLYQLLLSHADEVRRNKKVSNNQSQHILVNSALTVRDFYELPSILYRIALLEFFIVASQQFQDFDSYKASLLSKIEQNIASINLETIPLTYFYQDILIHLLAKKNNVQEYILEIKQGIYIKKFGCRRNQDQNQSSGLSLSCLPIPMSALIQ
ncbi:MAG: hypothetical protein HAW62_05305 [Endozoicomonadaceae bacterium]|nr:hypothetical protein [Endozoicomonadaceae bacterium]